MGVAQPLQTTRLICTYRYADADGVGESRALFRRVRGDPHLSTTGLLFRRRS